MQSLPVVTGQKLVVEINLYSLGIPNPAQMSVVGLAMVLLMCEGGWHDDPDEGEEKHQLEHGAMISRVEGNALPKPMWMKRMRASKMLQG